MCFGFFKKSKKITLSIPEGNNSIIFYLSPKNTIPFDSRLIVPENYSALLCYRNKMYYELNCGNFVLNSVTIPEIIKQQSKSIWTGKINKHITNFLLEIYFLKHGNHNLHFSLKHKRYRFANKQKGFIQVDISINYSISDPRAFMESLIYYYGKIKTEKYNLVIKSFLYDDINLHIIKNELESSGLQFSEEYMSKMLTKFKKKYSKIGIDLLDIKLENHYHEKEKTISQKSFFDFQNENEYHNANDIPTRIDTNHDNQIENKINNQNTVNNNIEIMQNVNVGNTTKKHCPNCQSAVVEGAMFCHVCGNKLD